MIDLSFLTEEEQESIQSVLRRDAELKRIEEQRVQNLQRSVSDRDQLRYLTGDWFYETKQHRHPDRIHGCDIIRASMKHTQKPETMIKVNGASSSALLSDKEAQTLDNGPVCQWYDESMISGKQLRSPSEAADERPCQVQAQTKSPERRLSQDKTPFTRSVKQNDDVRRSPSKTCHPKVLPRDSSGDTRSGVPGSPLKTFPIDINHQTNSNDNHMENGSMSSIYNGDVSDVEVQGNIQFAVNYIQKLGEFHIFVVLCRGLAVTDTRRSCSDPFVYVKCYLLPDKTKLGKRKTTVKKKTLNPSYNEILRYSARRKYNLNISVWHNETFGRNSFLGQVDLDLSEWDFSNTRINDYTLKDRVCFYSCFICKRTSKMESGEVQIWVKDCKKLSPARGLIIDPFVKCTVLPDTSRKSRQKTRVVKRTANPMFNHTMVYDGFRPEDLREACVEITVWDHDRLNNHYVGGLRLGLGTGKSYGTEVPWMDSTPSEAGLWQRMLQCDSEWVEDILPLRMLELCSFFLLS
uniref:Synaptotagmin-like protein 1 n=1 Tax=Gouania willdenowi TaxID=441366 RepID=A0A8C5GHC5_GOUWI